MKFCPYPSKVLSRVPLLFIILLFAKIGRADSLSLDAFEPVMPGLEYLHVRETNHPWSIHIARFDRTNPDYEIISTHASNQIAGLSTVVAQIGSLPAGTGKPVVAVNGDFFVIAKGPYQGDPLGLQILNGELSSAPGGATFWSEPGGKYFQHKVDSHFTVTWPYGTKSSFGLNEARRSNRMALFTPAFGSSTRTTNGVEYVLEPAENKPWLPLKPGGEYSARVREIRTNNTPLTADTMVLSLSPELAPHFSDVRLGARLQVSTATTPDVSRADYAIGGRPALIEHERVQSWHEGKGTNAPPRHPRTAIGWNQRYFYFVVVDGRQKGLSMGMTFAELAKFMKQLGCAEALNLDGGGSTTFWLNGKVLNSPSDKHLRTVANALILVKRGTDAANGAPGK